MSIIILIILLIFWFIFSKRERYQPNRRDLEDIKIQFLPEERVSDDLYLNQIFPNLSIRELTSFAGSDRYNLHLVQKYFQKLGIPLSLQEINNSLFLQGNDVNLRALLTYFANIAPNAVRILNLKGDNYLQIRKDLLPGEFQFIRVLDDGMTTYFLKPEVITSNSPGIVVDNIGLYFPDASQSMDLFSRLNRNQENYIPWYSKRALTAGRGSLPRGQYLYLRSPYLRLIAGRLQIRDLPLLIERGDVVYLFTSENILGHLYRKGLERMQRIQDSGGMFDDIIQKM